MGWASEITYKIRNDAPCPLCLEGKPTDMIDLDLGTFGGDMGNVTSKLSIPCCYKCKPKYSAYNNMGCLLFPTCLAITALLAYIFRKHTDSFLFIVFGFVGSVILLCAYYIIYRATYRHRIKDWISVYAEVVKREHY